MTGLDLAQANVDRLSAQALVQAQMGLLWKSSWRGKNLENTQDKIPTGEEYSMLSLHLIKMEGLWCPSEPPNPHPTPPAAEGGTGLDL